MCKSNSKKRGGKSTVRTQRARHRAKMSNDRRHKHTNRTTSSQPGTNPPPKK